jgi:hypothetical protein
MRLRDDENDDGREWELLAMGDGRMCGLMPTERRRERHGERPGHGTGTRLG